MRCLLRCADFVAEAVYVWNVDVTLMPILWQMQCIFEMSM